MSRETFKDVPKKVFAGMFMTALLVIVNILKYSKCLSGEWINNLGCAPKVGIPCGTDLSAGIHLKNKTGGERES